MTFQMPVLVDVLPTYRDEEGNPLFPPPDQRGRIYGRHTARESVQDLEILVTNYLGNPEPVTIPYTRDVNEEHLPNVGLYMLGLEVDGWIIAHPEAEFEPYVSPVFGPADFPLTDIQLRQGLRRHGIPLSMVQAAIDSIADEDERDEAQIYWDRATIINWAHPMTQGLMALAGISTEDAAAMWMAAKDYPA